MGQTTSNVARKLFRSQKSHPTSKRSSTDPGGLKMDITPFVYKRHGSMYFDEDGDLAHEFYVEVRTDYGSKMQKIPLECLRPQGEVDLPFPRFHVDFPVIVYEVVQS